jgi:hypothetical protein
MAYRDKNKGREQQRLWYLNNKRKVIIRALLWKEKNHEKVKASGRLYVKKNRKEMIERNKRWRERNPDKRKELDKRWRERNPDKCKEKSRRKVEKLTDSYIRDVIIQIIKELGVIRRHSIPPELINAKRQELLIRRELSNQLKTN